MKNTIKVILDSSKYMTQACFTQKHGNFIFGGVLRMEYLMLPQKFA
ncbi:MAG: hypothetical protein NC080_06640 [Paraprevotella sp.]|nr:hypothetical protein [Paraprevotella sp.]